MKTTKLSEVILGYIHPSINVEALAEWEKDDIQYFIIRFWYGEVPDDFMVMEGALDYRCGYCLIKGKMPDTARIEVYGGVTYQINLEGEYVLGFDCQHGELNAPRLKDLEWLKGECERMAKSAVGLSA